MRHWRYTDGHRHGHITIAAAGDCESGCKPASDSEPQLGASLGHPGHWQMLTAAGNLKSLLRVGDDDHQAAASLTAAMGNAAIGPPWPRRILPVTGP